MPLTLPDGRAGRLAALGVTAAAILLVWFAAVSPLLQAYAEGADALTQRQGLLRRMQELARTLPALRTEAQAGAASGSPVPVLEGATDAVAGALLQQRLQEMASQAGATLSSTETLPTTAEGGYRRIGLRVSLNSSWPVLIGLLQAVEQASPRMLVDDIEVHASRLLIQPVEPPLEAGFTVIAFRAAEARPPGSPQR